jgi:hypothetical protein
MKTDRELLELAAKAAGLTLQDDRERGLTASADGYWWPKWNPLERDGDAFRLAVKLGLEVSHNSFGKVIVDRYTLPKWMQVVVSHGNDPYMATRRAIVRAAAAMQEANEQPVR